MRSSTLASRLAISRKSKHIELKHLWTQDVVSKGIISLEKVGTHHIPSDVLTKFFQAAVLGQHFPKLNLFKDPALSQDTQDKARRRRCQREDESHCNSCAFKSISTSLQSKHQGQHPVQGHICMLDFDSFEDQREILTQRFRNASTRIRRAFTPPPCRRSVLSESRDSDDSDIQNEDHLFIQRLGQDVSGNQPLSATRRWSFMQLTVYLNQIVNMMINKSSKLQSSLSMSSGQDSRCSECVHQSKEKTGDTRKDSITS